MSGVPEATVEGRLLESAALAVASYTGFAGSAVSREALRRALRARLAAGLDAATLLEATARGDAALVHPLAQAAMVGETYFFRHPEHFQLLLAEVLPAALGRGASVLRAWSAGCASGEEAYSLAGCLLAAAAGAGRPVRVEVVGTDLQEGSLAAARAASYGEWSVRPAGPQLVPVLAPADAAGSGRRHKVLPHVRGVCRFEAHNLLVPPPEALGTFDVIFCRNVLCYFEREAARRVVAHLASVLRPGGLLAFAAVDVDGPPPELVPWSPSDVQLFTRPLPGAPARATPPTRALLASPPAVARRATPPPPRPALPPAQALPPVPASSPAAVTSPAPAPGPAARVPQAPVPAPEDPCVAQHLAALEHIERGQRARAVELLEALVDGAPHYAPGLLELALLRGRAGRQDEARILMEELLSRLGGLQEEAVVAGPELLPARYYRASAEAFLAGRRAGA
jgi:chemotaxis protein methyltransferase CheR